MKLSNKRAFTLIELVIVIAVIAILACILIPNFSNLIGKANRINNEQVVKDEDAELYNKLKTNHKELFELDTTKGLFLYVAAFAERSYRCYLSAGELENPNLLIPNLSVKEARLLLKYYNIPEKTTIIPYHASISSYLFFIDDGVCNNISSLFENLYTVKPFVYDKRP